MTTSRTRARLLLVLAAIALATTLLNLSHSAEHFQTAHWLQERDQTHFAHPVRPSADALSVLTAVHEPRGPSATFDYKHSLRGGYKWATDSRLRALTACTVRGDCPPNAHKIAVIAMKFCHLALFDGYNGGEGVW